MALAVTRFINEGKVRSVLRPEVVELADTLGLDVAMDLVERLGGIPTYVPHAVTPDCTICASIPEALAHELSKTYAGEYLKLPLSRQALIFWLTMKGLSAMAIAKRLRIDTRSVHRVIATAHLAQLDLFAEPAAEELSQPAPAV